MAGKSDVVMDDNPIVTVVDYLEVMKSALAHLVACYADVSSGDEYIIEQDAGESDDNENEGTHSMDLAQLTRHVPLFELHHDALGTAL